MTNNDKLVEQWVVFLGKQDWDLFVTITFRESRAGIIAKKLFKWFFKHLNTFANKFFQKYIRCWVFFEQDVDRKGVHIHTLIKGIHPSMADLLEDRCKKFFGISKVEPYDSKKGAKHYLGKKYNGYKLDDFDYYKINSAKR